MARIYIQALYGGLFKTECRGPLIRLPPYLPQDSQIVALLLRPYYVPSVSGIINQCPVLLAILSSFDLRVFVMSEDFIRNHP